LEAVTFVAHACLIFTGALHIIMNTIQMKDFVQKFVNWYVDSHAMPDAVSHMKLIELVREAELILKDKSIKKS
jgi:hypothetical protein